MDGGGVGNNIEPRTKVIKKILGHRLWDETAKYRDEEQHYSVTNQRATGKQNLETNESGRSIDGTNERTNEQTLSAGEADFNSYRA